MCLYRAHSILIAFFCLSSQLRVWHAMIFPYLSRKRNFNDLEYFPCVLVLLTSYYYYFSFSFFIASIKNWRPRSRACGAVTAVSMSAIPL